MKEKQKLSSNKWTKLAKTRPTIGVNLSGLEDKINCALWQGIVDQAKDRGVNLITFVPRDLDIPVGFQAQANVLYDLVDLEQLDGLLIWTAPIINHGGAASIKRIFDRYRRLPMVAIEAGGPEDIPRVILDDYQAMRGLIIHLVETHGYRRIAFIRGPDETHQGAYRRYQAYRDVLAEYGLPFDPDLISPPTSGIWLPEVGEAAIALFLDQRQVNFEAVVGTNDLFAIGAMRALQARGIQIPQQVAVVGFDDVDDSMSVIPSLTTVSIQMDDLGRHAVELLLTLLEGEKVPQEMAVPLKPLLIRQSCGCPSATVVQAATESMIVSQEPFSQAVMVQRDNILAVLRQAIEPGSAAVLQFDWADRLLTAFSDEMEADTDKRFLVTLETMLQQIIVGGSQVESWPNVISVLRRSVLPHLKDSRQLQRAEDLWLQAQILIGETAQHAWRYRAAQAEQQNRMLAEIGSSLMTTFDVAELMTVLAQALPRLGIPSCYLSLYENPQQPTDESRLILAYDEQGQLKPEQGQQVFPSAQLMPAGLLPQGRCYSLVVQALYFREQQLGFVLFEGGPHQGMIYEMLREHISSAVQGAMLVKQTRQNAENLEMVVSETVATAEEMQQSVNQTELHVQEVAEAAKKSVAISRDGHDAVNDAMAGMESLQKQVEAIAENAIALSERTTQIGTIIAAVQEIANQSKLLALNARIEAVRAGDNGRSFAVVAMEMKNLAEQSREATAQVREILHEIQQVTSMAVTVTEAGSAGAQQGIALVNRAGEVIQELAATIEESALMASEIATVTHQQTRGMDQLVATMRAIRAGSEPGAVAIDSTKFHGATGV